MMMEEFSWALEFEKIKDKDDLNAIMEDSWFLSDNDLMARVGDLFEEETKPEDCAVVDVVAPDEVVVPALESQRNNAKKKETVVGEKRKASSLVKETKPQKCAVVDVAPDQVVVPPLESRQNNVKKEETLVGGKRKALSEIVKDYSQEQRKRQCVEKTRVNLKDKKSGLKETLQIPYAQRIELAKQKLQQSYARCKDNRKKTCLIGVNYNIPKNQCGVSAASRIINLKSEAKSIVKETKLSAKETKLSVKETKLSVKETLKIPYEQRVEMVKRKLEQQRRDSCKQQTCIIGVNNVVPKKPCHREIYKANKVGTRLLRHHDLPVPRPTMRGY